MSGSLKKEVGQTLQLALPMMLGLLSTMAMYAIDSAMVGRLGVTELAAAAFGSNLLSIFAVAGFGLNAAMHVLVARAHGRGEAESCGLILRVGLWIGAVFSTAAACWIQFHPGFLDWFGNPPEVVAASRGFCVWIGWSLVPTLAYHALRSYCEAQNRPWLAISVLWSGLAINLLFNWLLIYGHWGFPALGVAGSGLATFIARCWMMVAMLRTIVRSGYFDLGRDFWTLRRYRWDHFRRYLGLGLPSMLQTMVEHTTFAFITVMMGWLGAEALAAHNIAIRCASFTFMVPLGLSFATGIRISQAVGREEWGSVRRIGLSSFLAAALFMAAAALVFFACRTRLPWAFLGQDDPRAAAVAGLASRFLVIAALFQVFDGLQVVGISALRGMSDVKWPTAFILVSYWGVSVPLGWWLGFRTGYGGMGLWYALLFALIMAASILVTRFYLKTKAHRLPSAPP